MVQTFYAYVDEAGDEGFGKLRQAGVTGQSRWLAIGAAIVTGDNDKFIPSWRDEIMGMFPKKKTRDLHFRFLNHDQRVAACKLLSEKPVGICAVLSNKETLLDSPKKNIFKQKGHLYNYLVRYLLERTTEAIARSSGARLEGARLFVTFSRRAGTDYQSMRDYLCLMRDGKEVMPAIRSIQWDVLDPADIRVENHSVRAGLQIADVLTSATCAALDPNEYGNTETRYALTLKKRYVPGRNGSILNCGFTLVPPFGKNPLDKEQDAFVREMLKK